MTTPNARMRKVGNAVVPVIALERGADKPLHRQIYESFRRAILEHQVRPLQQVPSTRALAAELGISRIPILEAYSQLLAEGFLESRVGAGTFVCAELPMQLVPSRRGNSGVRSEIGGGDTTPAGRARGARRAR